MYRIYWGAGASQSTTVWNNFTSEEFQDRLASELDVGDISVWRSVDSNPSVDITYWTITFLGSGNVQLLSPVSFNPSCNVSAIQFLQGNRNEFTIEPKKASGDVLREVTTAVGFEGEDIFFVETYRDSKWYRDEGVASYNPVIYEVVSVRFPLSVSTPTRLSMLDYLTPGSSKMLTTPSIAANNSAYEVQVAIEALEIVDSVDVWRRPPS